MSDVDPYAQFITAAPADADPYAQFLQKEKPGIVEDVAKAAPVGLAQGIIAIPGMAGDLQQLAKGGSDLATAHGVNPFSWLGDKFADSQLGQFLKKETEKTANLPAAHAPGGDMPGATLPSSGDIQGQVEKATGPFYQAQTPVGKAVQTAAQVAPALATGGQGLVPTLAKAAGAGMASEGAGEAADVLKGHLPVAAQPYAEPVARAVGAMAGTGIPSVARRVVTPLPMTDQRLGMVNALRQTNPELVDASSAGQLTQSPNVMRAEARAPRMADLPQRQNEAYTQSVMRQAGAPGAMFNPAGLDQASHTGAQLEALRNAHNMSPTEFAALKRDTARERANLFRSVGQRDTFDDIRDQISGGPTQGRQPPLNMTGQRYGAMKQIIQSAADNAPTSHEQIALSNVRGNMMDRFHNSMPPDEAQRLRDLDQQYSNYKTVEGIPTKSGQNTVTPQQVHSKAARGSDLETHADQATNVMTPMPKPNEGGPISKIASSVGGGLLGSALGYATDGLRGAGESGLLGAYMMASHGKDYIDALKNGIGRAVARPGTQAYLKNQMWRPGPASTTDAATMARLLMAPPVTNLLPEQ